MEAMTIRPVDPCSAAAQPLIDALDDYQAALYPPESNHLDPADELLKAHVQFLGAFEADELVGIGAVKLLDGYGELKRMYVSRAARGRGIGGQILRALEAIVEGAGLNRVRLETGIYQPEAIALYRHSGYTEIEPFGDYRPDPLSLFMEKRVGPP